MLLLSLLVILHVFSYNITPPQFRSSYLSVYNHFHDPIIIHIFQSSSPHGLTILLFSHLCLPHLPLLLCLVLASYPCPGSIAMTAFHRVSLFCASFGSTWCCFKSIRTLSIHLSPGLPGGIFPPTFIVVTCFATFVFSLLITWPYNEMRFWATYVVIGLIIESVLNFSFLIRSFLVLPSIHLNIFISIVCILCCPLLLCSV